MLIKYFDGLPRSLLFDKRGSVFMIQAALAALKRIRFGFVLSSFLLLNLLLSREVWARGLGLAQLPRLSIVSFVVALLAIALIPVLLIWYLMRRRSPHRKKILWEYPFLLSLGVAFLPSIVFMLDNFSGFIRAYSNFSILWTPPGCFIAWLFWKERFNSETFWSDQEKELL